MSAITRTWRIVRAARQEGPGPTRGDAASTAATGEEWVMREICGPWGIDPDDLVEIHRDICASTAPNIIALPGLTLVERIDAAVAAGFTNGLALGLTHASRARARW